MKNSCNNGFTLLEIMISLFVMSIGVLGATSMVVQSQRASQQVDYRSKAALYVYDMAERMRANLAGFTLGGYDSLTAGGANPGCITTGCSGLEMAQYDSFEWGQQLTDNLPQGSGDVTRVLATSIYTITVTWTEKRRTPGATPTFSSISLQLQP